LLADGRQAVLLRKGGIAETAGVFQLEHADFWLYATYLHQQHDGMRPDLRPLLEEVRKQQTPAGIIRFTHFASAPRAYLAENLESLLGLQDLHGWSEPMVRSRFAYRRPGLFVVPVRVFQANQSHEIMESAEYAGCKSWVELDAPLPTEAATPVLEDQAFSTVVERLVRRFPMR
jgi:hypothetical protein